MGREEKIHPVFCQPKYLLRAWTAPGSQKNQIDIQNDYLFHNLCNDLHQGFWPICPVTFSEHEITMERVLISPCDSF